MEDSFPPLLVSENQGLHGRNVDVVEMIPAESMLAAHDAKTDIK